MKNAYITLLSSIDYIDAVKILKKSLISVNSRYPLLVMITEDIVGFIDNDLKENSIVIKKIEYTKNVKEKFSNHSVLNTASKVFLFSLKEYDKLLYIDADSIVLQNLDECFSRLDGTMLLYDSNDTGLSNFFLIEPKNHREEYYLKLLQETDCFDGELLGDLFFYVRTSKEHQFEKEYSISFLMLNEVEDLEKIKSIHFSGDFKPWKDNGYIFFNINELTKIQLKIIDLYEKYKEELK